MNNYFMQKISKEIFEKKYCLHGEKNEQEVLRGVSKEISDAETNSELKKKYENIFYDQLISGKLIPAGRILANARPNAKMPYYNNCYVIDIEDSIEGIYESLKQDAMISKTGGGVGLNFSKIRPKEASLSKGGMSSGVISFMKVFNQSAKVIHTGGSRRSAHLGVLNVDHPEIESFITAKQGDEEKALTQFNISVGITDAFINAVKKDDDWDLVFDGKIYKTIKATYLYDLMTKNSYCVSGETEIPIIEDNSIKYLKIKDTKKDSKTISINPITLDVEVKNIDAVINNGIRTTMTITLSSGETFSITPDHKMFVAKEGNPFKETIGEELEIGDWISIAPEVKISNDSFEDEDFYTMLGFWIGDGSLKETQVRFAINTYTQPYILPILERIAKNYGVEVKKYTDKRTDAYHEFVINSKKLVKVIKDLGVDSNSKKVPEILFNKYSKKNTINFIKGYFTADGHVHRKQKNIIFNTKDEVLINGIKKLLLTIGVHISISKSSSNQFNQLIYTGVIKVRDMKKAVGLYPLYFNEILNFDEYLPVQSFKYKNNKSYNRSSIWKRNGYTKMSNFKKNRENNLYYSKVIDIEYNNKEEVYDLTIEDNHNFINSDGVVFHNFHNEPGILNIDNINRESTSKFLYDIDTANPCFTGDTIIAVANGNKGARIKDLVGETFSVYSAKKKNHDEDKWETGIKRATAFYTGEKEVITIILSDGTKFRCTPEHKLATFDGEYVEARNSSGINLSSVNVSYKIFVESVEWTGETESVYDLTVEDNHNFYILTKINNENFLNSSGVLVHNCGEQPLPPYGVCCLSSLNLTKFVKNSFTDNAVFDYQDFEESIKIGVRFLDNVLSKTEYPLELIRKRALDERRIGLGFTGLGDMFAMLKIKYGSSESKTLTRTLAKTFRDSAYSSSIELAKEKGSFNSFEESGYFQSNFIKRLPEKLKEGIRKNGIRNIALTNTAPTGTTSFSLGNNCSSGIEPIFSVEYERVIREDALDENTKTEKVYDYAWLLYQSLDENFGKKVEVPSYFVTTKDISIDDAMEIQSIWQEYLCAAISKTLNLPEGTTFEQYKNLFMKAYDMGLKGFTTFNPDGSMKGILSTKKEERKSSNGENHSAKRPNKLECDIHKLTHKGERFLLLVGLYEEKPYEIFVTKYNDGGYDLNKTKKGILNKTKKGKYELIIKDKIVIDDIVGEFAKISNTPTYLTIGRFISMGLRHKVPLQFIIDQLNKDKNFAAFERTLGRVLKKYIAEGEEVKTSKSCPECGSKKLYFKEGCLTCSQCGWCKCD